MSLKFAPINCSPLVLLLKNPTDKAGKASTHYAKGNTKV